MKRKTIPAMALTLAVLMTAGCNATEGNATFTSSPATAYEEEHKAEIEEQHVSEGILPQVTTLEVSYVRREENGEWEEEGFTVTDWSPEDGATIDDTSWVVEADDATTLYSGLGSDFSGVPATLYIHFSDAPSADPQMTIVNAAPDTWYTELSMDTTCDTVFICGGEVYAYDDVPVSQCSVYPDGAANLIVELFGEVGLLHIPSSVSAISNDEFLAAASPEDRLRSESQTYISTISFEDLPSFDIESPDLQDGYWDEVITNTNHGENRSPELSWDAVEGASYYQVIMIDGAWLHMDVFTEGTSLEAGSIGEDGRGSRYVGPYPPSGTHTYSVFVFALQEEPGSVRLLFNNGNNNINLIYDALNEDADGNTGNVLAYGRLDGNYTHQN